MIIQVSRLWHKASGQAAKLDSFTFAMLIASDTDTILITVQQA